MLYVFQEEDDTFCIIWIQRTIACMSCDMRFPTMWYVRPAKAQTSLHIRAVWLEPLLVVLIFYEYLATDQTSFGV